MKNYFKIISIVILSILSLSICGSCTSTTREKQDNIYPEIEEYYGIAIDTDIEFRFTQSDTYMTLYSILNDKRNNKYIDVTLNSKYILSFNENTTIDIKIPMIATLVDKEQALLASLSINDNFVAPTSIETKYYKDFYSVYGEDYDNLTTTTKQIDKNVMYNKYTIYNTNKRKSCDLSFVLNNFNNEQDIFISSKKLDHSYHNGVNSATIECKVVILANETIDLYFPATVSFCEKYIEGKDYSQLECSTESLSLNQYMALLAENNNTEIEIIEQCILDALYNRPYRHVDLYEKDILEYQNRKHVFMFNYKFDVIQHAIYYIDFFRHAKMYYIDNEADYSYFALRMNRGSEKMVLDSYFNEYIRINVFDELDDTITLNQEYTKNNYCECDYEICNVSYIEFIYRDMKNTNNGISNKEKNLINTITTFLGLFSVVALIILGVKYGKNGGASYEK